MALNADTLRDQWYAISVNVAFSIRIVFSVLAYGHFSLKPSAETWSQPKRKSPAEKAPHLRTRMGTARAHQIRTPKGSRLKKLGAQTRRPETNVAHEMTGAITSKSASHQVHDSVN